LLRDLSRFLFVAFVGICLAFSTNTVHAHGVTLKVHHFLPADSPFHTQFLLPWLAKLEEESHGLLRFQVSPAMEGTPLYNQVKDRTADIVWTGVGNPPGRFPAFEVFKLPLAMHSSEGSSRALWEYVQTNDFARKEFAGVRLLAVQVSRGAPNDKAIDISDIFIFAMNAEAYKSLSDELKKVIAANSGAETSAWLGKALGASGGAPKDQQRAQSLLDEKIKELDQHGLDGKALIESARALLTEHDPRK
jgi:TRAP-type C4-dicarboxylate transport system substrate-binding protein